MDYKKIIYFKNTMMRGKNILFSHQKGKENEGKVFDENVDKCMSNVQIDLKSVSDDKMAQDLMRLVGDAIDKWANLYGMNNLPKKIIFQQALTILNAMNTLLFK